LQKTRLLFLLLLLLQFFPLPESLSFLASRIFVRLVVLKCSTAESSRAAAAVLSYLAPSSVLPVLPSIKPRFTYKSKSFPFRCRPHHAVSTFLFIKRDPIITKHIPAPKLAECTDRTEAGSSRAERGRMIWTNSWPGQNHRLCKKTPISVRARTSSSFAFRRVELLL